MMQLVVFSGLPGSGKSSLAEAAGRALHVPVFAKDWLEGVLKQHGIVHAITPTGEQQPLGSVGYELLTTLALRQFQLGQSVILDSVTSTLSIRDRWRSLAREYAARWQVIECIYSDETLHRTRLVGRQRNIPHWPELEWTEVERIKSYYAAWEEDRLIVDAGQPFETNLESVLTFLSNPE